MSAAVFRLLSNALLVLGLAAPMLAAAQFVTGADVSWVDQEESSGYHFYDSLGRQGDPFVLLKAKGVNAVRLRVWVNPSGGWNNGSDALYKAQRAQAQGMRVMVDFHYSDTWADPGHQTKPAAWQNDSFSKLESDVYSHTWGILNYFKSNGVNVSWVQVGNEISQGLLWPEGYVSGTNNFANLAALINQGYDATKAVYPGAQVILHLNNGEDNNMFRWWFDNVKAKGAKWDVIGMSYYPSPNNWQSLNTAISANMADMVSRYGKRVMVCEVGMDWQQASTAKSMIVDLINKVKARGSYGLGVFYWEPDAYPGWQGYTLGALNNSGQFTQALDAFLSN